MRRTPPKCLRRYLRTRRHAVRPLRRCGSSDRPSRSSAAACGGRCPRTPPYPTHPTPTPPILPLPQTSSAPPIPHLPALPRTPPQPSVYPHSQPPPPHQAAREKALARLKRMLTPTDETDAVPPPLGEEGSNQEEVASHEEEEGSNEEEGDSVAGRLIRTVYGGFTEQAKSLTHTHTPISPNVTPHVSHMSHLIFPIYITGCFSHGILPTGCFSQRMLLTPTSRRVRCRRRSYCWTCCEWRRCTRTSCGRRHALCSRRPSRTSAIGYAAEPTEARIKPTLKPRCLRLQCRLCRRRPPRRGATRRAVLPLGSQGGDASPSANGGTNA